jgi:hypothetical protein
VVTMWKACSRHWSFPKLASSQKTTSNLVKVVRPLPSRIRLNAGQDPKHRLRPGMSVESKALLHSFRGDKLAAIDIHTVLTGLLTGHLGSLFPGFRESNRDRLISASYSAALSALT